MMVFCNIEREHWLILAGTPEDKRTEEVKI